MARAFQALEGQLGIRVTNTTGYNPKSNGQVERMHRDLNSILQALTIDCGDPFAWEEQLPAALFALRTAVCRSTGLTPYKVLFGGECSVPIDSIFQTPPSDESTTSHTEQLRAIKTTNQRAPVKRPTPPPHIRKEDGDSDSNNDGDEPPSSRTRLQRRQCSAAQLSTPRRLRAIVAATPAASSIQDMRATRKGPAKRLRPRSPTPPRPRQPRITPPIVVPYATVQLPRLNISATWPEVATSTTPADGTFTVRGGKPQGARGPDYTPTITSPLTVNMKHAAFTVM